MSCLLSKAKTHCVQEFTVKGFQKANKNVLSTRSSPLVDCTFSKRSKSTGFHKQPYENSFVHCGTAAQKGTEYRVTGMNLVTDMNSSLNHSTDIGLQNSY